MYQLSLSGHRYYLNLSKIKVSLDHDYKKLVSTKKCVIF